MAMVQTLIPAFSQLLTPEKRVELSRLFAKTVKISLLGLIPSVMVLLIIAKPFLTLWAGKEFGEHSIYPFYILLIGIFFSIIVYVPNCILLASGRSDVFAKFYLFEIIPYIAATLLLVNYFGILGAAMAFALKETVNSLIFMRFTKRHTGLYYNFKAELGNFALGFLAFSPAVLVALCYDNFSIWLLPLIPICLVLYIWVAWTRLIEDEEKNWIMNKISPFINRKKLK